MENTYNVKNTGYHRNIVMFDGVLQGQHHVYKYEMPVGTVDLVVFNSSGDKVLLMKRGLKTQPECFRGSWAIPGGHLEKGELAKIGAQRELREETGVTVDLDKIKLVDVATDPLRDPRQWTIGIIYTTVHDVDASEFNPEDKDEVAGVQWAQLKDITNGLIDLAFDHKHWVNEAHNLIFLKS
jgi:8-oxo-dGTP diphosphatase